MMHGQVSPDERVAVQNWFFTIHCTGNIKRHVTACEAVYYEQGYEILPPPIV